MGTPEESITSNIDNGGDEELREDRGDFFESDDSEVKEVANESNGDKDDKIVNEDAEDKERKGEDEDDKVQDNDDAAESQEDSDAVNSKSDKRGVPYERFNSVNEQKKLLEQQNEMLKQLLSQQQGGQQKAGDGQQDQQQTQQQADPGAEDNKQLRELRHQLKKALYADDEDRYDEIQNQIDQISERRSRALIRAEMEATAQASAAREESQRFMSVANEMVKQFPVLDAKNGNPEAITKVVALRDYYINQGNTPADALRKASTEIGELYVEKQSPAAAASKTDPRKSAAIERGVKEANDQPLPTSQAGVGARAQSARLNPEKMSEREFKDLPEEERARLRGDTV